MRSGIFVMSLIVALQINTAGAAENIVQPHSASLSIAEVISGHAVVGCEESIPSGVELADESRIAQKEAVHYGATSGLNRPQEAERVPHDTDNPASQSDGKSDAEESLAEKCASRAKAQQAVATEHQAAPGNPHAETLRPDVTTSQGQKFLTSFNAAGGSSTWLPAVGGAVSIWTALQSIPNPWTEYYEYDALGRLTKVTFSDGSVTNYTLDNAGNRTSVNTTAP